MENNFYQRYNDMNCETRKRTEENLTAMINSVEKVRLFVDCEAADKLIASALVKLQFIHKVNTYKCQKVLETLRELYTPEIVRVWNAYIKASERFDDEVYEMEQFDDLMEDKSPLEVVRDCFHGEFSPCDSYWCYNENVDPCSFDYWDDDDSPINLDDVAAYMIKHGETFGIQKVAEILKEQYIDGE